MRFVRAIWKLLVGIKDALVLLFMLMFFGLLYAGLSARPAAIGDGVLALDLDGVLVEQPVAARPFADCRRGRQRHPRISPSRPGRRARRGQGRRPGQSGRARPRRLPRRRPDGDVGARRRRSTRCAESGKPVIAYATGYTDDGYQLAAARVGNLAQSAGRGGDRRAGRHQPLFQGPARQAWRDRQRLSRRHLQVGGRAVHPQRHVARSAGECQALGEALLETWREDVLEAGRPRSRARRLHARPGRSRRAAGGDLAKAALSCKLVDKIGDRRAFEARLAELGGEDEDSAPRLQADQARRLRGAGRSTSAERPDRRRHRRRRRSSTARPAPARPAATPSPRRSKTGLRQGRPQGAGRPGRQPRRIGARVRAHPPGAARRQGKEDPGRRVDGQCRRIGRLLGRDPGDFIFAEPSTITGSIGVFGVLAELPGNAGQARHRRRRHQDDAAVGRARPAQGPSPQPTR